MATAMEQAEVKPSLDECGRCLHLWSEHEVVTDSWGDEVRVCPEEDWWDTDAHGGSIAHGMRSFTGGKL